MYYIINLLTKEGGGEEVKKINKILHFLNLYMPRTVIPLDYIVDALSDVRTYV